MKIKQLIVTATAIAGSFLSLTSWATNFTWTGAGDATSWSDPANWDKNSNYPKSTSDTATFPDLGNGEVTIVMPDTANATFACSKTFTVTGGSYRFVNPVGKDPSSIQYQLTSGDNTFLVSTDAVVAFDGISGYVLDW